MVSFGVACRNLLSCCERGDCSVGISEVRWIKGSCEGTSWLGLTTTIGGAGAGKKVAGVTPVPERRSGGGGPFTCSAGGTVGPPLG